MVNIAIVEDDPAAVETLQEYLSDYFQDKVGGYAVDQYYNADEFLFEYSPKYDIVFMDIEFPGTDGVTAAAKFREVDQHTLLIFVTRMAQYAIKGYEVDALSFIVKPVNYHDFTMKMRKALAIIETRKETLMHIKSEAGDAFVSSKDIDFIETRGHYLEFHVGNIVYTGFGSLSDAEEKLGPCHFLKPHRCYLVNPVKIDTVSQLVVHMKTGEEIPISRPRKKEFYDSLIRWLGGKNNL